MTAQSRGLPVGALIGAFVAGVIVVAIAVAGVVVFRDDHERGAQLAAQQQASQAACAFARTTNTYDYQGDLDGFLHSMKDGASDKVVSSLEQNWNVLRDLLKESKVKSWVDKVSCGYQSGDEDRAKVLVNISLMKTNSVTPQPAPQNIAVDAGMQKVGDRWIVNEWELAMLPGAGDPGQPSPGN